MFVRIARVLFEISMKTIAKAHTRTARQIPRNSIITPKRKYIHPWSAYPKLFILTPAIKHIPLHTRVAKTINTVKIVITTFNFFSALMFPSSKVAGA